MNYRVGIGYDIHRLVKGRKLILGGIEIPHVKGLLGHSDADVLLHAISDAVLGALGEPDIGELFPDTDGRFKGASSLELLKIAYKRLKQKKFKVINIDAVIITEEPKIAPYKYAMRRKISGCLGINTDCVNVKAKTNERLGEIGKKQAVAVYAVAAVVKGG